MFENVKMIMGAGQGFDCLTVKTEQLSTDEKSQNSLEGYSEIKAVVNTLAIDDFQDEMPCPQGAILIRDSYLRDFDSDMNESSNEEASEDETMFGNLNYVKTLAYNDIELSLVTYDTAIHITSFHTEKGVRTLLGNKLFDIPEDAYENIDKWTESQVIKSAFNNIDSYEDATRFVGNYVLDKEMLENLNKGFVAEDTAVTFVENAWELKENEDGQEEDE